MGAPPDLQLVGDDLPLRLQRRLHCAPRDGLGVGRRACLFAAIAWVPLMIGAVLEGRVDAGAGRESLLDCYWIHVECLISIPLLVLGEAAACWTGAFLAQGFERNRVVAPRCQEAFERLVRQHVTWRRSNTAWSIIALTTLGWVVFTADANQAHLPTAIDPGSETSAVGFTGAWYLYVIRFLAITLLLGWLWRIALWWVLIGRLVRLDFALVPTHADRAMGIGFFERTPLAFAPFVLAVSATIAAKWAHYIVHHGAELQAFNRPLAALGALLAFLMLTPLCALVLPLWRAKRRALLEYGGLIARHGRLVHQRWIQQRDLDDPVLDAPELGPVADITALYEVIQRTRLAPISVVSIASVAVPLLVPMLLVSSLKVPLGPELLKIFELLF